jgi:cell wall assembly regulator SMI1
MVELLKPVGNLTEEKILEMEERLGTGFPADYRRFLLEHNGGRPSPARFDIVWQGSQECGEEWKTSEVSRFLAIHDGEKANFSMVNEVDFRKRLPPGTIAIAQDPGGNVILLALDGPLANRVLFWVKDREAQAGQVPGYDNVGVIADSFDDLLANKLH